MATLDDVLAQLVTLTQTAEGIILWLRVLLVSFMWGLGMVAGFWFVEIVRQSATKDHFEEL